MPAYANARDVLPARLLVEVQQRHVGLMWVPPPKQGMVWRDREMLARYQGGMSTAEIAQIYGLSQRWVQKVIQRLRRKERAGAEEEVNPHDGGAVVLASGEDVHAPAFRPGRASGDRMDTNGGDMRKLRITREQWERATTGWTRSNGIMAHAVTLGETRAWCGVETRPHPDTTIKESPACSRCEALLERCEEVYGD